MCIRDSFGGVPLRISYDNTTIAVSKVMGRERELTRGFLTLESHHLFDHHFCRVGRGNEKGHVENHVGYSRRNLLAVSYTHLLRIQLDATPLPSPGLGYQTDRAGPEERIEHDPRFPPGTAPAGRIPYNLIANASPDPLPSSTAALADPLRTRGQKRTLDKARRKGSEVRSPKAGSCQRPVVAGVLASCMARYSAAFQSVQSGLAAGERSCPTRPYRDGGRLGFWAGRWPLRRAMRHSDGVEVEVVAGRAGQKVHELPRGVQPIGHAVGHRIGLGPGDPVAHDPTCLLYTSRCV